jgi:hypothetical protein
MLDFFNDPPGWFWPVMIVLLLALVGFFVYQRKKRPED